MDGNFLCEIWNQRPSEFNVTMEDKCCTASYDEMFKILSRKYVWYCTSPSIWEVTRFRHEFSCPLVLLSSNLSQPPCPSMSGITVWALVPIILSHVVVVHVSQLVHIRNRQRLTRCAQGINDRGPVAVAIQAVGRITLRRLVHCAVLPAHCVRPARVSPLWFDAMSATFLASVDLAIGSQ